MFPLFQQRDFSALISDSFTFLKVEGKEFYKQYISLIGIPIALLILFIYFIADFSFSQASEQSLSGSTTEQLIENFISTNSGFFALAFLAFVILGLLIGLICYAFPVFYFKNMAESNTDKPNQTIIIHQIKNNLGRLFIFLLGYSFIIAPIMVILFVIAGALSIIIIGIPILLIMIPTVYSLTTIAFFEFLTKKTPFFASIGIAIDYLKANFWTIVFNTFLFYIIMALINWIPATIYQMVFLGGSLLDISDSSFLLGETKWFLIIYYCINIIISIFTGSMLLINQGLVYYSARESKENNSFHSQINSIGSSND